MGEDVYLVYHDRASQVRLYRGLPERPDPTGIQSWGRCQRDPPALAKDVGLVWMSLEGHRVLTIPDIRKKNPHLQADQFGPTNTPILMAPKK
ncbi:Hypothetical predicted protein [Pelobates cultripes]|uniref:Uncharacterized protein n=1 Tax=Pelobates cultripes TaxID=61616 RepID=A0AAD1RXG2_PELCU|nr:Hypothetical predicted protein [Pelobates cultripes]